MEVKLRIADLRSKFSDFAIDGYIIPSTDEYRSEYTSKSARRLEYISGFTGSNGIVVVMKSRLLFFTDSRYTEQANIQLSGEFEIYDLKLLHGILSGINGILGYDDMLFTEKQLQNLGCMNMKAIDVNLVDAIWSHKPAKPSTEIYHYGLEYSGEDHISKMARCRENMVTDYVLVTASDSICWLLNVRASDVEFCPLMLGYLLFSKNQIWLFINNPDRISHLLDSLPDLIVMPERDVREFISSITSTIAVDSSFVPAGLSRVCKEKVERLDLCQILKSFKNDVEIQAFANVHIKDAVALCEAIADIENRVMGGEKLTEYDASLILTEFRKKQDGYIFDSFPPIVGFAENGAVIHYRPLADLAKTISPDGLLLIDSGGHYFGGTSDVTRTISIGSPNPEVRRRYTQVLKGNIAVASMRFPEGIAGCNIDSMARIALWQDGLDYAHSTGHGVGNALSVHEGPQSINRISNVSFKAGMVVSIEPGFYKTGEYGIRIEDLVYVKNSEIPGFLEFEILTLVPYCKALIELEILSDKELSYIRSCQDIMMEKVYPKLSQRAKTWVDMNAFK